MSGHGKHLARHHHWHDGVLKTLEYYFNTLEEAMSHFKSSNAHVMKVFNTDGELVHSTQSTGNSYA
jgi:hypothetical protein